MELDFCRRCLRFLCICCLIGATTVPPLASGQFDNLPPVSAISSMTSMLSTGVGSGNYVHASSVADQVTDNEYRIMWRAHQRSPFVDAAHQASWNTNIDLL